MSNSIDDISPGNEPIIFSSLPGEMVGPGRFELPTPRLSSVCSNQLSYEPVITNWRFAPADLLFEKLEEIRGRREDFLVFKACEIVCEQTFKQSP